MTESADNKLIEHIITIFDNYDDTGSEQGWKELRKKYPDGKWSAPLFLSSVLALLIISGVLVAINYNQAKKSEKPQTRSEVATHLQTDPAGNKPVMQELITVLKSKRNALKTNEQTQIYHQLTADEIYSVKVNSVLASHQDNTSQESQTIREAKQVNAGTQRPSIILVDTLNPNAIKDQQSVELPHPAIINPLQDGNSDMNKQDVRRKIQLAIYISPFFNYSRGSTTAINLGAGLESSIPLNKNLDLVGGLSFAQNNLLYKDKLPDGSAGYLYTRNPAFSVGSSASAPALMGLEAKLLSLDIPLNLKYTLSKKSDNFFISAGLSSFIYLNETYRYTYIPLSNNISVQNDLRYDRFKRFDFIGVMNLSLGFTYKKWTFEPFLKQPVDRLGSQDIRFGSAGMNLKMTIITAGKRKKD